MLGIYNVELKIIGVRIIAQSERAICAHGVGRHCNRMDTVGQQMIRA
jgi:hypothetical protein